MKAIMYHYVQEFNKNLPKLKFLHIDNFRKQLDFFESHYGFVSKKDFLDSLKTGEVNKGVILTFDDGLKCHFDYVYKELIERNLWGIFYVSSQFYKERVINNVHLNHILLSKVDPKKIYEFLVDNFQFIYDNKVNYNNKIYTSQKNDFYTGEIKSILNYFCLPERKSSVIKKLINEFSINENLFSNYYFTIKEIKEMDDNGMLFGSHSHSHMLMSEASNDKQKFEIDESFKFIKKCAPSSYKTKTFCYPFGGFHSFNNSTENILSKRNVLFSFNVEHRDINKHDLLKRPQSLPRYDCNFFPNGKIWI